MKDFLPRVKIPCWEFKRDTLQNEIKKKKKNIASPNSNSITISGFMFLIKFYVNIIKLILLLFLH